MIRFPCVYCGQQVEAPEQLVRKQVRCPGCGHRVRVRPDQREDASRSSDASPGEGPRQDAVPKAEPCWEAMTNEEILQYAHSKAQPPEDRRKRDAQRYISLSCARYDDLTLFTFSLALLLLVLLNINRWRDLAILLAVEDIGGLVALAGVGIVLSLVNIIFRREGPEAEKQAMLLFAVLVPAGAGAYASWIIWKGSPRWLMVFPAWNVLSSAALVFEWYAGFLTTDSITGGRPTRGQFLLTTISTTLLLLLCQYVFKLHWAVSFSVTICYTLSLQGVLQEFFPASRGATAV